MQQTLLTTSPSPDLDGLACVFAYNEYLSQKGQDTQIGIMAAPRDDAQFILDYLGLSCPPAPTNPLIFDKIVLLDASERISLAPDLDPLKVTEIIDHRSSNEVEAFPNAQVQIETVGAAATLIAEKFLAESLPISPSNAALLQAAIISNTLNFQANVTTERDRQAAAQLQASSNLPADIAHQMFAAKSDLTGPTLQERLRQEFGFFLRAGKRISIVQLEILDTLKLVQSRKEEILGTLNDFQKELNLEIYFVSLVDLEAQQNIFLTDDPNTQKIVEETLGVVFEGNAAIRPGLLMRKEIMPRLNKVLTNC